MQKHYILILALLSISHTFAQQIPKGRSSRTTRSIFTRTAGAFPSTASQLGKRSFRSSTTFPCPKQLKKSGQRTYSTKQFETSNTAEEIIPKTTSGKFTGSKILEYAKRNPQKVIGVVSGIATTGVGFHQFGKKTDINYEIQKLSNAVSFMNYPSTKKQVYELLDDFIQKGIVNEENVHGQTPVIIILGADPVSDDDKASMLLLLFNNGAIIRKDDKKTALNLVLGLSAKTQSILSKGHQFRPELKTLKLILPYLNKEDIENLKTVFTEKTTSLQENLQNAEELLNELLKEKGRITGFIFNRQKQQEERIARESINNYKKLYKEAKKIQKIAENDLKARENKAEIESQRDSDYIWKIKEQDYPL